MLVNLHLYINLVLLQYSLLVLSAKLPINLLSLVINIQHNLMLLAHVLLALVL